MQNHAFVQFVLKSPVVAYACSVNVVPSKNQVLIHNEKLLLATVKVTLLLPSKLFLAHD